MEGSINGLASKLNLGYKLVFMLTQEEYVSSIRQKAKPKWYEKFTVGLRLPSIKNKQ